MKLNALLSLIGIALFTSCIQDEALNTECDIEKVLVETTNANEIFYNDANRELDVASSDSVIVFRTKIDVDSSLLKNITVNLQISPGASVYPANGTTHDFSRGGVNFTVTSEDGSYKRNYKIQFKSPMFLPEELNFEDFELDPDEKYYLWFENGSEGKSYVWATGNPGFRLSKGSAKWDQYPTAPCQSPSISGHSVKLVTRDTGVFGALMNMPIAAGNLYIGTFDVSNALQDAMAATRFGLPFTKKPIRLEGYYQFTPGSTFTGPDGKEIVGRTDAPDIYAVLYENTDENGIPIQLCGDDVLTHPNIVALARIKDPVSSQEWVKFNLPFEYRKEIDLKKLSNLEYNLAVVFSSSIDGATFMGAVGSTLIVDAVRIICEE